MSTASTLAAMQITTSQTTARSSRAKIDRLRATQASGGNSLDALHDHRIHRDIVAAAPAAGLDRRDLIDDVHAVGDAREYGVAEVAARVVEKVVVLQIDEELRGGAVDVVGARHGERAAPVLQAVVRLVLHGRMSALLRHVLGEAAALDDEAGNDTVEDGAVEEFILDVAQKIRDRQGRLLFKQLDGEIAQRGFEADHVGSLCE